MDGMSEPIRTAAEVVAALEAVADPAETVKIRRRVSEREPVIGVRMGALFDIAARATGIPDGELDALFGHAAYEPRLVAFCILDFRARKRLAPEERADLARVYLERRAAITVWDMVDRAAPRVIGWPLLIGAFGGWDAERGETGLLGELAADANFLMRRTAITAPLWFVKRGSDADVALALTIADGLDGDPEPLVRSAVKTYRRHAERRLG